jgi:hypothetical protein
VPNYLSVRNWDKFQHYKKHDEPAAWIKLHNKILSDYEFQKLSEVDQGRLLKLWLLAARTGNRIPNDPVWVRAQIGAKTINLDHFIEQGWLEQVYSDSRKTLGSAEQRRSTDIEQKKYPTLHHDKLLEALTDKDERTEATINKLVTRYGLTEGDFMWALECATGPGVNSPTKVAVAELTKRGRAKAA